MLRVARVSSGCRSRRYTVLGGEIVTFGRLTRWSFLAVNLCHVSPSAAIGYATDYLSFSRCAAASVFLKTAVHLSADAPDFRNFVRFS